MFEDVNFYVVIIPLTLLAVCLFFATNKIDQSLNPQIRALKQLRRIFVVAGIIFVVLWFLLPQIPVLSTFGYPKSTTDIQNTELLLGYLQDYNKAIVRTTQVVHTFLLWSTVLLVFAYQALSSAVSNAQSAEKN